MSSIHTIISIFYTPIQWYVDQSVRLDLPYKADIQAARSDGLAIERISQIPSLFFKKNSNSSSLCEFVRTCQTLAALRKAKPPEQFFTSIGIKVKRLLFLESCPRKHSQKCPLSSDLCIDTRGKLSCTFQNGISRSSDLFAV